MGFLTNWVFWVILAIIVFIMAIIGFLAEGTIFKKKDSDDNINKDSNGISEINSNEKPETPSVFAPLKSASTPETLNVSSAPSMPETLNVSSAPSMPETLNVSSAPTMPETLNVSSASTMPETLNVSSAPSMPETLNASTEPAVISDNPVNNTQNNDVTEELFNDVPETLKEVKIEKLDDNLQTNVSIPKEEEKVNQTPSNTDNRTNIWNM